MQIFKINVEASLKKERLIYKQFFYHKIFIHLFEYIILFGLPLLILLRIKNHLKYNQPIENEVICLVFAIVIDLILLFLMYEVHQLKRIKGVSKKQNFKIIEGICKSNNWNVIRTNQEMTIINFSWKLSGFDWGKQLTILYDEEEILVNCISYRRSEIPSPYHWFANKKKTVFLKDEFEIWKHYDETNGIFQKGGYWRKVK